MYVAITKQHVPILATRVFNNTFDTVLESQNIKRQMLAQAKVASEKCDKLEQHILCEENKINILQDEVKREKAKSESQTSNMQIQICDLEKTLQSTLQVNENLQRGLWTTEDEVKSLKLLIQQNEKKAKEDKNQPSIQIMETLDKLGMAEDKLSMFQRAEKDLERAVERVSQLQNQLLLEQEKTTKLKMQIGAESALESVGDPVDQSVQIGATLEKTEGKMFEKEGNTHECRLTLNQTGSEENGSNQMSSLDFTEIISEGIYK